MSPRAVVLALLLALPAAPVRAQELAAVNAEEGRRVFAPCRSCHQVGPEARNQIGPVLNGLFGRPAGRVASYSYSAANKSSGVTWDEATFRDYIRDPKAKIPGTKMIFAGIKDERKIGDLVAYLHTFDAAPVQLDK